MTAREKLWLRVDRVKSGYRRSMTPVFIAALDRQIIPVINKITEVTDIRDFTSPALGESSLNEAYEKLYMTTAVDFAKEKRARLKKSLIKGEEEIFEDLIRDNVRSFLRLYGGSTITAVGNTSKELIQKLIKDIVPEIIDRGLGAGEAMTMLRDRIQSEWHEAARWRTERIVRTEVNRASNFGSLEGMKSVGMPMMKVWLSAFTEKSRKAHMEADGQEVDIYDTFKVGGESLQYPGDPAGSADNTINCLCSTYEKLR